MAKGKAKITIYNSNAVPNDPDLDSKIKIIKLVEPGIGFGELALLYNEKRSATIQALTDCETYTLEESAFKAIIVKSTMEKRRKKVDILNRMKLFDSLDKF